MARRAVERSMASRRAPAPQATASPPIAAAPPAAAAPAAGAEATPPGATAARTRTGKRRHVHVVRQTLAKAWHHRILGLSAEAAFWQLLSLPPLFLALLGSLGYFSGTLGPDRVNAIEGHLVNAFARAFTPTVVEQIIQPTVSDVLRRGRADVISIGFLIALWAGSSATSTFVNTVTIAYGMRDLRGAVHSRLIALWIYLVSIVLGVIMLPLLVLGPSVLVGLAPAGVRGDAAHLVNAVYWPAAVGILLAGLITFYHVSLPKRPPWRRGVPGALLAAAVFLLGSTALRAYISFVVGHGLSYGALAAPIAALLFFYILAIAVLLGAEFNATIDEFWPSTPTRRQRRRADRQPSR
jgi:membrane protein